MAGSSRCSTTSPDGAGGIFDPLARWRRFGQGGSNVMTSNLGGGLQLDSVSRWRGTSSGYLDGNSCDDSGAWSRAVGLRSSRTRESGVLSGGLVAPAHERVVSDSVFYTLPGGRFRCNSTVALGPARQTAVALSVRWCLPLCSSFSGGPHSSGLLLIRGNHVGGAVVFVSVYFVVGCV
jgi:hypothetical protein